MDWLVVSGQLSVVSCQLSIVGGEFTFPGIAGLVSLQRSEMFIENALNPITRAPEERNISPH
jgi:hypothetical protein